MRNLQQSDHCKQTFQLDDLLLPSYIPSKLFAKQCFQSKWGLECCSFKQQQFIAVDAAGNTDQQPRKVLYSLPKYSNKIKNFNFINNFQIFDAFSSKKTTTNSKTTWPTTSPDQEIKAVDDFIIINKNNNNDDDDKRHVTKKRKIDNQKVFFLFVFESFSLIQFEFLQSLFFFFWKGLGNGSWSFFECFLTLLASSRELMSESRSLFGNSKSKSCRLVDERFDGELLSSVSRFSRTRASFWVEILLLEMAN